MAKQHIFVMAMDEFHEAMLERLRGSDELVFHPLLDRETAVDTTNYDVKTLLGRARQQLRDFDGRIDALIGYWDFPTSTLLPILRHEFGLRGPSLESTLRCEHKYWARVEQRKVSPNETPRFALVNPFANDVLEQQTLPYPFWLKPVRSHSSQLGFKITNRASYSDALEAIREGIYFLAEPFTYLMSLAQLPENVARIDGWYCIAEEMISADRQCTVEGYVLDGEVVIYGTVDSLREGATESSFSRYQYPSTLPADVQDTMARDCANFLHQVGFDNSAFNIEFFYDESKGHLRLLEVNTRCSKSHSPLFELVDGVSNKQAVVDVALGRKPRLPEGRGRFEYAAKVMFREYENARVTRCPTAEERAAVERDVPGTRIHVEVNTGTLLSELLHQDSYSYETAVLFVGGESPADIDEKTRRVRERLQFEYDTSTEALAQKALRGPQQEERHWQRPEG